MPTLDLDAVPKSYDEAIRLLAAWHATDDPDMRVWVIPDDEPDPSRRQVRLVEVSNGFPESGATRPDGHAGTRNLIPVFPLGKSAEFPYQSRVAQVTPAEWDRLRRGELRLTQPWDLNRAREVAVGD